MAKAKVKKVSKVGKEFLIKDYGYGSYAKHFPTDARIGDKILKVKVLAEYKVTSQLKEVV